MTIEGNIVNIDKTYRGRIEIGNDGIISAVGKETGTADIVLKDELIFPGFVDLHVHARECVDHSLDYKEDFVSAGEAAINGGVVAFADMPNNTVPPVDDKSYEEKYALTQKSPVEIVLYAGIGKNTQPLTKTVPYKVYTVKYPGNLEFDNFEDMERVVSQYHGQEVSFHCEDPVMMERLKHQPTHRQQHPPEAEINAIDFVLDLIEKHGLNGKICHCTTKQGLQMILAAKKRGVKVSIEVTPHHLYFDQAMVDNDSRNIFTVNPPIRQSREERLELIEALKRGDIDYLATDHAPHTLQEKQQGEPGMMNLDTYGNFATWLMQEHKFTPQDILRVCSLNPANFFNKFSKHKYGKIAAGYSGSLTIVDMTKPAFVEAAKLKAKVGWSQFEGVTFPGSVTVTIIKGTINRN